MDFNFKKNISRIKSSSNVANNGAKQEIDSKDKIPLIKSLRSNFKLKTIDRNTMFEKEPKKIIPITAPIQVVNENDDEK